MHRRLELATDVLRRQPKKLATFAVKLSKLVGTLADNARSRIRTTREILKAILWSCSQRRRLHSHVTGCVAMTPSASTQAHTTCYGAPSPAWYLRLGTVVLCNDILGHMVSACWQQKTILRNEGVLRIRAEPMRNRTSCGTYSAYIHTAHDLPVTFSVYMASI